MAARFMDFCGALLVQSSLIGMPWQPATWCPLFNTIATAFFTSQSNPAGEVQHASMMEVDSVIVALCWSPPLPIFFSLNSTLCFLFFLFLNLIRHRKGCGVLYCTPTRKSEHLLVRVLLAKHLTQA
ncbi:hypothetical protein DM01DRAFT_1221458 [Hesseltinella vesiculosa]|uniref:Uncharacterized protein n=1 Tax=Hesseltinella vesiculosa TaxID=101127 RepID=A0A1X2GP91_9FUNG|nr:hypothetical protein DM01DRAFT_1221458 [Hesseltinella vesiculosa]